MAYQQPPTSPPPQASPYQPMSPTNYESQSQRTTPKRRRLNPAGPDSSYGSSMWTPADPNFDFDLYLDHELPHRASATNPHQPFVYSEVAWDLNPGWDSHGLQAMPEPNLNATLHQPQAPGPAVAQPRLPAALSPRLPPRFREITGRAYRPPGEWTSGGWPLPPINFPQEISDPPLPIHVAPPDHSQPPRSEPPAFPPAYAARPAYTPAVAAVTPSSRRKPEVTVTLSRASKASIEALEEHKRECPACQLDFEPDNYLAVISCCGTAMHANCLSAWVNSQTYAKNKVCMKCRKKIDARRHLNNVVPPINDQSWDSGVDFNAPDSVKGGDKIELDVTSRSSEYRRRLAREYRRDYSRPPRSQIFLTEEMVPPEYRSVIPRMNETMKKQMETMEVNWRRAREDWEKAFDAEARSGKSVVDAREALEHGRLTRRELDGLVLQFQEAKEIQERRHRGFRNVQRESEMLVRRHGQEQRAFLLEIERVRTQQGVPLTDSGSDRSSQ